MYVFVMAMFRVALHLAVQAIDTAALLNMRIAFKLNGGMPDLIFFAQHCFERLEGIGTLAGGKIIDKRVA